MEEIDAHTHKNGNDCLGKSDNKNRIILILEMSLSTFLKVPSIQALKDEWIET